MRLPPGGNRRVPLRPPRDDAVSEDLADRLPQPLRDFERAALFNFAQDRQYFGRFNLSDGARADLGKHIA